MIAPHQQAFADTARPYEGLWYGTGTGKTRTALHTVRKHDGAILVVAPKTTVQKQQWLKEAKLLGMQPPTVISYETFRRDYTKLPRFEAVIADEAHRLFGVSPSMCRRAKQWVPKASQLYEAMLWYLEERRPDRFIPATATPNKTPMSIYAAATLLGHKREYRTWRDLYYVRLPMDRIVYAPKRTQQAMDDLAAETRDIGQVLRLEDIKDVPEQSFIEETFALTAQQAAALKTLPGRFTDDSALRAKRHQVENGVLYEDVFDKGKVEKREYHFDNGKLDYIIERALEFPKMVVFANYTAQVKAISRALKEAYPELPVFEFTGETENRKEIETEAESLESAVIVAQAAVSSEWEFPSCPVVIFASLTNRSIDYIQGKGRVQRYNAVKKNLYIHLITDHKASIDKRWFETIMSGRDFNEALHV